MQTILSFGMGDRYKKKKKKKKNLLKKKIYKKKKLKKGTGGGISMKHNDVIFIAPSGVQKERIQPNDMFIMHPTKEVELCHPKNTAYKKSQCTPLFFNAFR